MAQRGEVTYPRSHSSSVWEDGPEPKSLTPSLGLLPQLPADGSPSREAWPSAPHSLSPPTPHAHGAIWSAPHYCPPWCVCAVHCLLPPESGPHRGGGRPWYRAGQGGETPSRRRVTVDAFSVTASCFPAGICWLLWGRGGQPDGALSTDTVGPPGSTEPLRGLPGPPAG